MIKVQYRNCYYSHFNMYNMIWSCSTYNITAYYHSNLYFSSIKCVALIRFYNYYNQLSSAFVIVLFKSLNVSLLWNIVDLFLLITISQPLSLHTFTLIWLAAVSLVVSCVLLDHWGFGEIKILMHSHQTCSLLILIFVSLALSDCWCLQPTIYKFVLYTH